MFPTNYLSFLHARCKPFKARTLFTESIVVRGIPPTRATVLAQSAMELQLGQCLYIRCIEGSLPILSVKFFEGSRFHRARIEAIHRDPVPIRIASWHIKGLNTTNFAKQMLCSMRIESITRQELLSCQQREFGFWHNCVHILFHVTHRTIALPCD